MPPPGLNLKQRLAALSLAPSSPTTPFLSPSSPKSPTRSAGKRTLFTPPWAKRQNSFDSNVAGRQNDVDRVRDVMNRVIFQAGVDYETRPMVVMAASALPDPREISYDVLLNQILAYLDLFVESDYTVVFFAAGGRHTPGWNWVWKAYRSLSRKYRKNLKCLYIVHGSFFSKMLFSLAGAVISPKFYRKITYIDTLSDLAYYVPLTQIDIPPTVYQENLKYEDQITLPTPGRSSMFGVPLEELMGYDGEKGGLPRVVRDCIQFLRETGMQEDGLFRRSPNSVLLRQAQEAYDRGHTVSLQTFGDPHLAAVLLKKFLRDLPDPFFSEQLYTTVQRCPLPPKQDQSDLSDVMYIRDTLLPELAPCAYILLSHVLHLMHDISLHASTNRMDATNLAIVLCPNLVKGSNPLRDVMMCSVTGSGRVEPTKPGLSIPPSEGKSTLGMIIKTCIEHYFEIFDDVPDRTEAIPPSRSTAHRSSVSTSMFTLDSTALSTAQSVDENAVRRFSNMLQQDDESIDDTMLIMPIGPANPSGGSRTHRNVNGTNIQRLQEQLASGTTTLSDESNGSTTPPVAYKPRQKPPLRSGQTDASTSSPRTPSVHTNGTGWGGSGYNSNVGTLSKAKSLIGVENGGTVGKHNAPMTIGRGTARKSTGSGVSAVGITASGFFSPSRDAPPVPQLPSRTAS